MDREELDDAVMRAAVARAPELPMLLVERANLHLVAGELGAAATDLDVAARLHAEAGATHDEARTRHLLATTQRLAGELADAEANARIAIELASPRTPYAVAAHAELAETLLLSGRARDAVAEYRAALDLGLALEMVPIAQAALHRRIAMAQSIAGDHAAAAAAADEAARLFAAAGYATAATRARIERATALVEAGLGSAATLAIADARGGAAADPGAQAELDLLEAARAVKDRDVERALELARSARRHALDDNAVLPYVAAALVIAELLETRDDRVGAYESLAVGWVTASDKVGDTIAGNIFREPLQRQRERWGAAAFDQIKAAYYARAGRSGRAPS